MIRIRYFLFALTLGLPCRVEAHERMSGPLPADILANQEDIVYLTQAANLEKTPKGSYGLHYFYFHSPIARDLVLKLLNSDRSDAQIAALKIISHCGGMQDKERETTLVDRLAALTSSSNKEVRFWAAEYMEKRKVPESSGKISTSHCIALGGEVVSIPPKCGGGSFFYGIVGGMKCACVCCGKIPLAAAISVKPRDIFKGLPEANEALYKEIHDEKGWKNPFLVVRRSSIEIIGRRSVSLADLTDALARLPKKSWPYGRIVAVQKISMGTKDDDELINTNQEMLLKALAEMGIETALWPDI